MSSKRNPISKSSKIKLGITLGDPSGIGAAVLSKALRQIGALPADLTLIGSIVPFRKLKINLPDNIGLIDLGNVREGSFVFGKVSAGYGKASLDYLEAAVRLIKQGALDCLVTLPVSKEAVNLSGLKFSGHTEYLEKAFGVRHTVMMLLNADLKFSLATRHLPLRDVAARLDKNSLRQDIQITAKALVELFGIKKPRICVCALNPHASDNGVIGDEERRLIKPALQGLHCPALVDGPLAADTAVALGLKKQYDCLIAMYHDQALIPLKLTSFKTGVNLTLGLPFVRTSPLHGTAFDIAAKPEKADPGSLIAAIRLALKCRSNQEKA